LRLIILNNLSFLISSVLTAVHLVEVSSAFASSVLTAVHLVEVSSVPNDEVITAPSLFVCYRISCAGVYPDLILVHFACWGIFVTSRCLLQLEVSLPPNMYMK